MVLLVAALATDAARAASPARPAAAGAVAPRADDLTVVEVAKGQSVRDVARIYLGDPDLWVEVLKVNGLASPTQVVPGMKLKVPRAQVLQANQAIDRSGKTIQQASSLGAKVFAPEPLDKAVGLRNDAIGQRRRYAWLEAFDFATQSQAQASIALEKTQGARSENGQAVLNQMAGSVENRRPSDPAWNSASAGALLVEQEKLRTLSSSQAEILFIDESTLRLSANSQAVIQKMRVDRLSGRPDANVSLVEGDVYALLGGSGKSRGVSLQVPGISTDTRSSDFWVSRQGTTTKIANYDQIAMVVTSSGGNVTLERNQGAIVAGSAAPVKRDLLLAPRLLAPGDDDSAATGRIAFSWEPVKGAVAYRVDVARDRSFKRLLAGKAGAVKDTGETLWWTTKSTESSWQTPADVGLEKVFYWRVAAVDSLGFPGAASESRAIRVRGNVESLYVVVRSPLEGALVRTPTVEIEGTVGTQCALAVDGTAVEVRDGAFRVEKPLVEGVNTFQLEVSDRSGHRSKKPLSVTFVPDRPAPIEYATDMLSTGPGRFVTRDDSFVLRGRTTPGAQVRVEGKGGAFSVGAVADPAAGTFHVQVPSGTPDAEYRLLVTVPSGFVTEDSFHVARDDRAPVLSVTSQVPEVTADATLAVQGRVEGAVQLRLGDRPLTVAGGAFDATVELVPGRNPIELVARDAVGNEARWGRTVVLDREPPRLIGAAASRQKGPDGDTIETTVRASDDTGLKRTAEVGVTVGAVLHVESLLLDRGTGEYRGQIALPRGAEGPASVTYVILEDQVGNKKTFVQPASAPARPSPGPASPGRRPPKGSAPVKR